MITFGTNGWTAAATPEYGGNLLRLAWSGNDLLRTTHDLTQLVDTPEQYGFPVLFPPGRIDGGRFVFEGIAYHLPVNEAGRGNHLHGVALRRSWQILNQAPDGIDMLLRFDENAPEFGGFPFLFDLTLSYRCLPGSFQQILTVQNRGKQTMPCAAGFHTMFQGVRRFRLQTTGMCWETLPPRYLATGRKLFNCAFDPRKEQIPDKQRISDQFQAPDGVHSAELFFDWGTLEYRVDEKFGNWYLWNGNPDAGFLAVEPLSCISGGLNLPECWEEIRLPQLAAGENLTFSSSFFIR